MNPSTSKAQIPSSPSESIYSQSHDSKVCALNNRDVKAAAHFSLAPIAGHTQVQEFVLTVFVL